MADVGMWTTDASRSRRLPEEDVQVLFRAAKFDAPLLARVSVIEKIVNTGRINVGTLEHAGALFHALNVAWEHWPEKDRQLMADSIRPVIRRIMGTVCAAGALREPAIETVSNRTRARLLERWLRVHTLYRVDPRREEFEQWVSGMLPVLSELSQLETASVFLNLTRLRVWPPANLVGEIATVLMAPCFFQGECGRFRRAVKEGVDRLIGTALQEEATVGLLQQIRASAMH